MRYYGSRRTWRDFCEHPCVECTCPSNKVPSSARLRPKMPTPAPKEKDMRNIESDCRQESLSAKTRIFANMRSCLHPKTVLKFWGISSSKFRMLTK